MTAALLESGARPLPVAVALGLQEGRRIALHPLALAGLALTVVMAAAESGDGPRAAFDLVTAGPPYFYGVLVYFAAHLVASRDRRAHSGELLAALPRDGVDRVAALCVAALVPTAVGAAFVLGLHALNDARGLYAVPPSGWYLAHGVLGILGGALLGVMVGRLSRVPGTALLVMVAMVVVDAWLGGRSDTLGPLATVIFWSVWHDDLGRWNGLHPGSPVWHAVYLAALCAMAAAGAFLREPAARVRALLLGGAATAVALVAGVLQLP